MIGPARLLSLWLVILAMGSSGLQVTTTESSGTDSGGDPRVPLTTTTTTTTTPLEDPEPLSTHTSPSTTTTQTSSSTSSTIPTCAVDQDCPTSAVFTCNKGICCAKPTCPTACTFGYLEDFYGCSSCICRSDPCIAKPCAEGLTCVPRVGSIGRPDILYVCVNVPLPTLTPTVGTTLSTTSKTTSSASTSSTPSTSTSTSTSTSPTTSTTTATTTSTTATTTSTTATTTSAASTPSTSTSTSRKPLIQHLDDPLPDDNKILLNAATWSLGRLTDSLGYVSPLQLVYIMSADLIISNDYSVSDDVVDMQFLVAPCHQPAPKPCSVLANDLRAFRIKVSANDGSNGLLAVFELKALAAATLAEKSSRFFIPLYIPPSTPAPPNDDDAVTGKASSSHKLAYLVPVVVSVSLVIVFGLLLVVYVVWARGKYQQQQQQDHRQQNGMNLSTGDFPLHYQNRSRQEYLAPRIDSALVGASIDIEAARYVITSLLTDKSSRESSGVSVTSGSTFSTLSPQAPPADETEDEGVVHVNIVSRPRHASSVAIQVAPAASSSGLNESEA